MLCDGALWRFKADPEFEWRYLRSVNKETLNCIYEEVSLEENGETRKVWAANGKIASSKETGFAVNHMTIIVWSPKEAGTGTKIDCRRINEEKKRKRVNGLK